MTIGVTRVNGDALAVVGVDASSLADSFATTRTGSTHFTVSRDPTFITVSICDSATNPVTITSELNSGESVEAVLKVVAYNASILGYAVNATNQINLMVEGPHADSTYGSGANLSYAADLQARVRLLGTTVGTNTKDVSLSLVQSVGFKLATS